MQIFEFKEIESTQLKAKELTVKNSLPFLVIADSQTKGKGTKDRAWLSPSGGLYFTLALELDFNLFKIDTVKFSEHSCLLVVETLKKNLKESFSIESLENLLIKPINDLYYGDAKLAGVLLESINREARSVLLIGIGLNIKSVSGLKLDRRIIGLEEIVPSSQFEKFSKSKFSKKLAMNLFEAFKDIELVDLS